MAEETYRGFGDKALPFLKALGFHQSRDWFNENRDIYLDHLDEPRGLLIDGLARRLAEEKIPLTCSRKTSVFRINRDVRFSKDKRPYNTHVSAVVTRTGAKNDQGLLYVHISPEESFLAAGFYQMEGEELRAFRAAIVERKAEFLEAIRPLQALGFVLDASDCLKKMPRGFEDVADPSTAEILKLKHLTLSRRFGPERLEGTALLDDMVATARAALPFLTFGWRVTDPIRAARDDRDRI
jgi:TIGR02453 family protein